MFAEHGRVDGDSIPDDERRFDEAPNETDFAAESHGFHRGSGGDAPRLGALHGRDEEAAGKKKKV